MIDDGIEQDDVLDALERLLASTPFRQAERSAALLRYLVDRSLAGTSDRLKEYTVGLEALGRGADFDPRTDPTVRAEASRLRGRLERYYAGEGRDAPLAIELPRGAYSVRITRRPLPTTESSEESRLAPAKSDSMRPVFIWTAGVFAVVLAFLAGAYSRQPSSERVRELEILPVVLQADERLASDVGTDVVIAPDGKSVVYVSIDSQARTHLRLRRFDRTAPIDLPGTEGGRAPFWSPDGRWIGFWAAKQLRKISVAGGLPVVLCDAPDLLGASWGRDNIIVATIDDGNRMFRIDALQRSAPEPLMDLSADRALPLWPQRLPDGEHVLFTALASAGVDGATIQVASLRDGSRKVLVNGGTFARFVAPNHLTYMNQGTLYAIGFDPQRLEVSGSAVPIVDSVSYSFTFGYAQVSFSDAGRLVYRRADATGPSIVARVERSGAWSPLLEQHRFYAWPALSPNGQHLAVVAVENGVGTLSVYDVQRAARRAWSAENLDAGLWTSDGAALIARNERSGLKWIRAATGEVRTLLDMPSVVVPWTLTRGDSALSMAILGKTTALDLWIAPVERRDTSMHVGTPTVLLQTRDFEAYPAISPDGRWLAYSSNVSGFAELYVRSLGDSTQVVPIARGGRGARWSKSGNELLYSGADQRLMSITFAVRDNRFIASAPREWAPVALANTGVLPNFNLGSDGESVVALIPARPAQHNVVHMVHGFSSLRQPR